MYISLRKLIRHFIETVAKNWNQIFWLLLPTEKYSEKAFLDLFRKETLNIHPSLLPEFRGAAPIPAAIMAGKDITGITVQRMALEMDSGDIIRQFEIPLSGRETTESLSIYVAEKSSEIITEVISDIANSSYKAVPQDSEKASYCSMIDKKDGLIKWSDSSEVIERMIRAYNPWPHAYTYYNDKLLVITEAIIYKGDIPDSGKSFKEGEVVFISRKEGIVIKTGNGFLAVKHLKPQSKKEMDFKSFINGVRDFEGTVLGD